MAPSPRFSVIICTRNRAKAVSNSLDAVAQAALAYGVHAVELIVVDNGSSDGTAETLSSWAANSPLRTAVVDEPSPGLSRARNAGLQKGTGEIVVMTDDDCEMEPDYFAAAAAAHAAHDRPAIIGGRVELGDPRDLPITIKTSRERLTLQPGKKPGGFVIGANLTLHRGVIERVGRFDERFGAGGRFKAAEDTDYILRASLMDIPVEYHPDLAVRHFHGRRSVAEAKALVASYNFGDGALYAKHLFGTLTPLKRFKAAFSNAAREMAGKTPVNPVIGPENVFVLKHILRGAGAFVGDAALHLFGVGRTPRH